MNIKLILAGLAAAAIVTTITFGYTHYRNVLAEREALAAELNLKIIENAEIAESRDAYQKHAEQLAIALMENTDVAQAAQREVDQLNEKLAKHDLEKLARAKPRLVERIVNRGTIDVFRMFEQATATDPGDSGAAAADSPAEAEAD